MQPGATLERRDVYPLYTIVCLAVLLLTAMIIIGRLWWQGKQGTTEMKGLRCKLNEFDRYLGHITREKDWLMEETHHRVKNNLQMAISLLNTQYTFLAGKEARQAVRNTQHRMFAISLVCQKLYQEDALSTIDITQYIIELLGYLKDEYEVNTEIGFQLKTVPLKLDVSMAIPFGLIMTEALSNILRHAFTDKGGDVIISLQSTHSGQYTLLIADNGVGLPDNFNAYADTSMGLMLMTGLSRQMRGVLDIRNDNGVRVTLEFVNDGRLPDHS